MGVKREKEVKAGNGHSTVGRRQAIGREDGVDDDHGTHASVAVCEPSRGLDAHLHVVPTSGARKLLQMLERREANGRRRGLPCCRWPSADVQSANTLFPE